MSLPREQEIRFCTTADGARIAYAASGAGPPLVKAANWLSHVEFDWNSPVWRHWLHELSRDHTLIRYDERGCGLSDRTVEEFSLDAWVRDLEAVVDVLGLERFPLLGISQGGPIAIAYAARHPERVSRLILYGSYACGRSHRGLSDRERIEREVMIRMIEVGWGKDHSAFRQVFTSLFIPDAAPDQVQWFNELQRVSTSPENASRMVRTFDGLDVRDVAPGLRVPTLVLHATGDLRVAFEAGRQLAALIPGSRFVPLDGRNHILLESDSGWRRFLREVRDFLGVPAEASDGMPARRRRIETLFDRALDLGPAERADMLARECSAEPEVRREVEALLAAAERSGVTARLAGMVLRPAASGAGLPLPPSVPQYDLLEQVGSGGMGVVYKARDRRLKRYVALKVLPPFLSADRELRDRFLREAKAVASLDHPNLCTIYEVAEPDDGQLVMVMPYYEGETLKEKIARGPLPIPEALEYVRQIAGGLAHAHAAGVVHRDIKPANVIVTPDGRVKILDFGVAKVSGANADLTRTGAVLGTLAYMSPEQSCGEPVDHRTDLWAVGAVLYEMLAGRQPFAGPTVEALFHAIQWRDPEPLGALRPEVPAGLEALVHRLLEKEPARRCEDARALTAALDALRAEAASRPGEAGPGDAASLPRRLPQVGRTAELGRLADLFRAACRGARQLAFVAGEPGVGKSTLLDMLARRVGAQGVLRIGRGQCLDQRGVGEPYLAVLEALGRLCREPDGAEVVAVLEQCAPTWLAQMPSLLDGDRFEAVQRRAFGATRDRMLREMVEALEALAARRPLLLILEDLHWSDPSTLDLLAAIARRPEPAQLLVLATYRLGDAPEGLVALVRTLRAQGLAAELTLEVWTDVDARAYLAARGGPAGLPAEVIELLLRRTGGQPLFMRSLLDDWQERGALVRDENGWRLGMELGRLATGIPDSLRASIEQRIETLPAAHRTVLEAASAAGAEFEVASVAAALGLDDEAVEAELRRLVRPGWLAANPEVTEWPDGTLTARYAFGHHLHQELLYERLPLARRARLHERIGRRLETAFRHRAPEQATVLAVHFLTARDDVRAVRYLKHAAEQAASRSAYPEAVTHLETALAILRRRPDLPDRTRTELELQRLLGPALLVTRGWGDAGAEAAYNRARELSEALDDAQQLGRVLYGLAYLHEIRGDYLRSQALIEERLRLSRTDEPGALIESHELLSCSLLHQGSFDAALRHARQALDLAPGACRNDFVASLGDHSGIACFYWAALSLWFIGRADQAVAMAYRAIELCGDAEHAYTLSLAEVQTARLFQHRREPERVAEHAGNGLAIAERHGYPYQRAIARTLLGWAGAMMGRVPAGLAQLRLGLAGQAELGAGMERPYSLGLLAEALASAGDDAEAEARVEEALALPEIRDRSFFWAAELRRLLGMLALRRGRADLAEATLRQAIDTAARQGAPSLQLRAAVGLCGLHRISGRAPDAPELVGTLLGGFEEGLDTPDLRDARAALGLEGAGVP